MADDQLKKAQVTGPGGDILDVNPEDVGAFIAQGYIPSSPEEVAEYDERKAYLQEGHDIEALGIGALSGVTGGLSDIALSQTPYADDLAKLHKYRSNQISMGQGVGGTVGAVATGGLGLAQRGLSLPSHLLGKALQGRASALTVGALTGAAEGAVFSGVFDVSQHLARGEAIDGEQLWTAIITGGGAGGLFGGAVGGLGGLLNRKVGDYAGAKLRNTLNDVSTGTMTLDEKAVDGIVKLGRFSGSVKSDAQEQAIRDLGKAGKYYKSVDGDVVELEGSFAKYRTGRGAGDIQETLIDRYQREIGDLVDGRAQAGAVDEVRGSFGEKLIDDMDIKAALRAADETAIDLENLARTLGMPIGGGQYKASTFVRNKIGETILPDALATGLSRSIDDDLAKLRKITDPRERAKAAWRIQGDYDRRLYSLFKDVRDAANMKTGPRGINTPEGQQLDDIQRHLTNGGLKNRDRWGRLAEVFENTVNLSAKEIDARDKFMRQFATRDGEAKGALTQFLASGGKGSGRNEGSARWRSVQDLIQTKRENLQFLRKLKEDGLKLDVDLDALESRYARFERDVEIARDAGEAAGMINMIRQAEHESVGVGQAAGLLGALGGAVNVPLGFAMGTVAHFGRSPTAALNTVVQVSDKVASRGLKWDSAVSKAMAKAPKVKPGMLMPKRVAGNTLNKIAAVHREGEGFDKKFERTISWQGDEDKLRAEIFAELGAQAEFVDAAQRAVDVGVAARQYMLSQVPTKLSGINTTAREKARFEAASIGIGDPYGLISDLNDGNLDFRQARAVAAVYPKEFAHMRDKLMEVVAAMTFEGKSFTPQQKTQLSLSFGIPLDDRINPKYMETMAKKSELAGERRGVPELHQTFENTSEVVGTRMEHN